MSASCQLSLVYAKHYSLHGVTAKLMVNVLSSIMVAVMEMTTDILRKLLVKMLVHQVVFCLLKLDHAIMLFKFGVTAPLKESVLNGPMEAVKEMKTDMKLKKRAMLPVLTQLVSIIKIFMELLTLN